MEKGLVHIYSGSGKGKTTAAVGLTVRAAGRGKKAVFCQFLKGNQSGELSVLGTLPGVTLILDYPVRGFTFSMTEEERAQTRLEQQEKWKKAACTAVENGADLLVLDEVMAAVNGGFLPEEWVVRFLEERPETLEVVLTGRNPPEAITALSDYHSEITPLRHPYEKGIQAREGIEY